MERRVGVEVKKIILIQKNIYKAGSTRAAVGMVTQACPYCYCSRFRIKEKHAYTTSLCTYICMHAPAV
jgi:hypothetical protein